MRIIFKGKDNTIVNEVSQDMFEKVYKPKGWVIEETTQETPVENKTKEFMVETKPTDETEIKQIERVKKVQPQQFNDKLIKGK